MEREGAFKRPGLLTLTVDRNHFGSPLDAFLIVRSEGYIRRLMRLLKIELWVWTLEFQMKSGDGWPHWHLCVELPPGGIDLERAWRLWRDQWGMGGLDLQVKRSKGARQALLYVTKYLTKFPKEGFPDWVLNHDEIIRWVGSCGKLGRLVSDAERTEKTAETKDQAESLPRKHRPLAVRVAECEQNVNFWREVVTPDGTVKLEFFGRLDGDVVRLGLAGVWIETTENDEDFIEVQADRFGDFAEKLIRRAERTALLEAAARDRLSARRKAAREQRVEGDGDGRAA